MTPPTVPVDVIVPNWNGGAFLQETLAALGAQVPAPASVVLVDNGSTDGSADEAERRWPWLRVHRTGANLGFGRAANAGAALGTSPFLCVLNSDAVAEPGWLAALWAATEASPEDVWAWGSVLVTPGGVIESAGDEYAPEAFAWKRWHGRPLADLPAEPYETFAPPGAAPLLRRTVFERLGGYVDHFFLYYEDVDLSARARLLGHRCLMVPAARVGHLMGASSTSEVVRFHATRNRVWTAVRVLPGGSPGFAVLVWRWQLAEARAKRDRTALRGIAASVTGLPRALRERRRIQADVSPGQTLTSALRQSGSV